MDMTDLLAHVERRQLIESGSELHRVMVAASERRNSSGPTTSSGVPTPMEFFQA